MNKKNIRNILLTIVLAFILYYLTLPACNITSMGFWVYILAVIAIYSFLNLISNLSIKGFYTGSQTVYKVLGTIVGCIFILILGVNFVLSPLFNSKAFSKRIEVNENNSFYEDVEQVDFTKVPLLDKDSCQKLGDRVMGQMPELVSQFYVSDVYTQINYNNEIIRVTPLEYDNLFKYLTNHKGGVKGYIKVNSVDGKSELIKLEKGMKYMDSAILNEDLTRKLRFSYPTKIFGKKSFEIDNDGNPYWIVPTIKYTGIELRKEVEGVIILDPITGKSNYYKVEEVPSWVDNVYSASLVIEQVDDWGL